jgi:metal-dependent hydrolase (beta-lactamase superfamily II)
MEHRIRTVDAVILTHGHADAIAGLGQSDVSSHEQCIVLASQPLADCQSLISHLYQLSLFFNPSLFLTNYLQTTSERSTNPQPPEALNHPRSPSTSHNRR